MLGEADGALPYTGQHRIYWATGTWDQLPTNS